MKILFFFTILVIAIQLFNMKKIHGSNSRGVAKLPPLVQLTAEKTEEIKTLQKEIELVEENNEKMFERILHDKQVFMCCDEDSRWNFDHLAVPAIIVSKHKKVIEANSAFYQSFNGDNPVNIRGFNIEKLTNVFDDKFRLLLNKLDYVLETGESSTSDLLEVKGVMNVLYRVYISRIKYKHKEILLLQFIKFPVVPKLLADFSKDVNLGILQRAGKPVFLVDSAFNIVDKNEASAEYFKALNLNTEDKKLYRIYPILRNRSVLDFISKLTTVKIETSGDISETTFSVVKIPLLSCDFFLFTVLNF